MLIRSVLALLFVASYPVSLADAKRPKRMLAVAGFSGEEFVAKPAEINYYRQEVLLKQIGQSLVDVTPFGTYVPGLAKSWTISRDRKTGLVQTAATFVKVPIFITDSVERSGDVC